VLVLAGIARGIPIPSLPPGRFGAVVVLPHVSRWFAGDARAEAAAVLAYPSERLPADVRAYAAALHRIVSALVGSGQLQRAVPPLVSRPVAVALWRGLPGAGAAVPRRVDRPAEPDDEAIEGEPVQAVAGS
jgi:hypothetical protein